jgi:hypothetical protein
MTLTIISILQSEILKDFLFPLLLVFFVLFAILERSKLFGNDKTQLNALVSLVISLIFVGAIFPKVIVSNLILFLSISVIAIFVILLLWGFVYSDVKEGFKLEGWMKWVLGIGLGVIFIFALIWATSDWWDRILGSLQGSKGGSITTNVIFILVIVVSFIVALMKSKKE